MARNPKWHRDEIILALDLYFNLEPGQMYARNPEVISLSEILNKLPIHEFRPDAMKFRNPNGVNLKLNNFKAFDPDYPGKGMKGGSKLDETVFNEFINNQNELHLIAEKIKHAVSNDEVVKNLYRVEDEEESEIRVKEGKTLYKLHKYKERRPSINREKKKKVLEATGKLICEVCEVDFFQFYDEMNYRYIECHHKQPLAEIDGETETTLDDLAIVCANCHRMLHSNINTLSLDTLRARLNGS